MEDPALQHSRVKMRIVGFVLGELGIDFFFSLCYEYRMTKKQEVDMNQKKFICPKCKKPTLSNFNTSEGVVVDFCDKCFGIWFDKDELANYIELSTDIPEIVELKKQAQKTGMVCPKCKGTLEELPFSSQTDFLVDRCESCGGIFFDAGEIARAEKASASLEKLEDRLKTVVKRFAEEGYQTI